MADWNFGKKKKVTDTWPKKENGDLISPAFLTHVGGSQTDSSIMISLLEAYGIPTISQYPNNGDFGRVIIGYAGGGVDIFVPETLIDDATDIINAEIVEDNTGDEYQDK